jgi:glycosyltransferase involved in cell wall biosynthesis
MTDRPNLLVIAPYAPPKNAAEPIQVRRILAELDKHATGRLLTMPDTTSGWAQGDASLQLHLEHFDTYHLKLPLHKLTCRILSSRYLSRFHVPDETRWIIWNADRIVRDLKQKPDVIYSRSYPMSSALLARKLKKQLGVPWIMHLSDPWADNPYAKHQAHSAADEAAAFVEADVITLTTEGQAQYYRTKYPAHAAKIFVSPNVMPDAETPKPATSDRLNIVYTGNLYGERSPEPLVHALAMLQPTERSKIRVDIYGNVSAHLRALLSSLPDVIQYHGPVSFAEATRAQQAADLILSIEPTLNHPLNTAFLPSKVLEALALGKPLLAITPQGSETATLCNEGYGYTAETPDALAAHLSQLSANISPLRSAEPKIPPARYTAQHAVKELLQHIARLT